MKLSTRIFALAFVNLLLLAAVFIGFAHYQFHLNLTSILVAPAEDRVRDVARSVASDIAQTQTANRTSIMARYAATYGVDFYLFDNNGPQLAGKPVQLPPGVRRELTVSPPVDLRPPFGREGARPASGPPPPRADAPPPRTARPPLEDPPPPHRDPPPPFARGDRPPPPEDDGFRPVTPADQRGPGAQDFGPLPDGRGPGRGFGPPPPPRRGPPPLTPSAGTGAYPRSANRRLGRFGQLGASGEVGQRGAPRQPGPRPSAANAGYQTTQRSEAGLYWALTRIPVIDPANLDGDVVHGTLIMAAPSFWGTPLFFDFKPFLGALAAVIAVFLLCWLPFIRGLTRSISRLTANTGRIAQGDFENHLPEHRSDEIGQLSVTINRMARRLSGFVTGQKRFLGDIAHELSAPIARIQFALGILDQRASENQRETVDDLHEEMRHMSGLVEELLSFSKAGLDAGGATLKSIEIEPVARRVANRETSGGVEILIDIPEALTCVAEPRLLSRALSNLVRNAVRHAGAGGPITLSARRLDDRVVISVSDCGPGLPPEELDRVFTPFYRLDASRNRDTGGSGLGLAIVKSCVEASGGTVVCHNLEPHGLSVDITLKAAS